MCTAFRLKTKDCYFGRNLDLDRSYGEEVCIMPRCYTQHFRKMGDRDRHYAIIGMASVKDGVPLFYDAANEHGLAMAGLNFPNNAYYMPLSDRNDNVAPFELIPWILGQCKTVGEARQLLEKINIADIAYSDTLPLSPLHWLIADENSSLVAEPRENGLCLFDNPTDVLTNNPPFEYQLANLDKYSGLRTDNKQIVQNNEQSYSAGLGAVGLPGDLSSASRFVRAVFGVKNSVCPADELSSVGQFFHLLSFVGMPRGVCIADGGEPDITLYSSCININRGLYYYTTYDNRQITCVNMHSVDLESNSCKCFPLRLKQNVYYV